MELIQKILARSRNDIEKILASGTKRSPEWREEHDRAVHAYIERHKLQGADQPPYTKIPFAQIVVMLRFLEHLLGAHQLHKYPLPSYGELLEAVDTTVLWVNHMLHEPDCWCEVCEDRELNKKMEKFGLGGFDPKELH